MRKAAITFWAVLTCAGWATAWLVNRRAVERETVLAAAAQIAAEQVGLQCEPVFGAWWIERRCEGAAAWLPRAVQELACPARVRAWRSTREEDLRKKLNELGPRAPGLLVLEERGVREKELDLRWQADIRR